MTPNMCQSNIYLININIQFEKQQLHTWKKKTPGKINCNEQFFHCNTTRDSIFFSIQLHIYVGMVFLMFDKYPKCIAPSTFTHANNNYVPCLFFILLKRCRYVCVYSLCVSSRRVPTHNNIVVRYFIILPYFPYISHTT